VPNTACLNGCSVLQQRKKKTTYNFNLFPQ
jgi:hypothetical protein